MREKTIRSARRIVLKVGSSLLASKGMGLDAGRIDRLARDISALKAGGREVVLVSSGAIICGVERLGLGEYPRSLPMKQAAAAAGQSHLIWAYERTFEQLGPKVAQVLLTREDLANRSRFLNSRHTLRALLEFGVVPIVNENDTVAVDEIKVGDNDTLAGMVAHLVDADLLVILSDVEGLFDDDPRRNPGAALIPVVKEVTAEIERLAGGAFEGTGGMRTKVLAARRAAAYGVATAIVSGEAVDCIASLFSGREFGTLFLPREEPLSSRKQWIGYTTRAKGALRLDDGAVEALKHNGKSLLPSGIEGVEGDFESGDAVLCVDGTGYEFAKGLANYSAEAIGKIKGSKTTEIKRILG